MRGPAGRSLRGVLPPVIVTSLHGGDNPRGSAAFAALIATARAAYPDVAVSEESFSSHLASMLAKGDASPEALRGGELYLAFACAERDHAALGHFEQDVLIEVDAVFRRFPATGLTLDDVKQRLREKLLLQREPDILGYAGRGPLRGWVRVAALHMLLNVTERETREVPTDSSLFEVAIGADRGAEMVYLKLACRQELEAAITFALGSLSDRDRALLRHAFVDGRNVDEIGAIYSVHRATAARWVASARERLVEATRQDLMQRLRISDVEAHSIICAALSGVGSVLLRRLV